MLFTRNLSFAIMNLATVAAAMPAGLTVSAILETFVNRDVAVVTPDPIIASTDPLLGKRAVPTIGPIVDPPISPVAEKKDTVETMPTFIAARNAEATPITPITPIIPPEAKRTVDVFITPLPIHPTPIFTPLAERAFEVIPHTPIIPPAKRSAGFTTIISPGIGRRADAAVDLGAVGDVYSRGLCGERVFCDSS